MYNDKEAMRAYVTGADHLQYTQLADGMVQINATHSNLKQFVMELRLDLHTPIRGVKQKLLTHNGTGVEHMLLQLQDADGTPLRMMDDDDRPLGYYGVTNGMTVHVIDTDPFSLSRGGGLDDVSQVEKKRMTDEEYDRRDNTIRAYVRKMREIDPNFKLAPMNRTVVTGGASTAAGGAPTLPLAAYQDEGCVAGIAVGARCEVAPGGRRGTVAFVGPVATLAGGYWVGVRLDEPLGKGDGSRGGITFFDAPDKYGAFVRPNFVTLGDFPPADDELGGGDADEEAELAAALAAGAAVSDGGGGAEAACCGGAGAAGGCCGGVDGGVAAEASGKAGCGGSCACQTAAASTASQPPAPAPAAVTTTKVAVARRRGGGDDDDSDSEL